MVIMCFGLRSTSSPLTPFMMSPGTAPERGAGPQVADQRDRGAPTEREVHVVPDRCAGQQRAEGLHDRRERLVLPEPADAAWHRVCRNECAGQERQQELDRQG